MLDIVFCNVPYIHLDYIYPAPAILKGVVQQHGYSARSIDFGIELFKICQRQVDRFYQVQNWFLQNPDPNIIPCEIESMLSGAINWFRQNPSKIIGISVLSFQSQVACWLLIDRIKQSGINSKIVIGGRGIQSRSVLHNFLPTSNSFLHHNTMDVVMTTLGLVDQAVRGDAEDQILQVLGQNNTVNQSTSDVFGYALPDYSDYELDCYQFSGGPIMWPIKGSKGCVRNCDFCDVGKLWGKYKYRLPEDVAKEMIHMYHAVGARHFQFTDSLVNGGLKPFGEFLKILADFNEQHTDDPITWQGQYICREQGQIADPDDYYALLYRAGGRFFYIGAESGSDHVLKSMNKKTTVRSLFNELEYFRRYNIKCTLLLLVGHWSETHEDFMQHLHMLINLAPYAASGTVTTVRIGVPALIFEDTPSYTNIDRNQITVMDKAIYFCTNNPDNTISEKIYRQLIVLKLAQKLGLTDGSHVIHDLSVSLNSMSDINRINDFYAKQFEKISG
jgi:hypothetical protein